MVIFPCFRAKVHLVCHWCLYNISVLILPLIMTMRSHLFYSVSLKGLTFKALHQLFTKFMTITCNLVPQQYQKWHQRSLALYIKEGFD